MYPANDICGLILAGGTGRRMGGVDKGLEPLRGRPMVSWVVERLRPQVATLIINANNHLQDYGALGFPVVRDQVHESDGGFAGPLAGLAAGLAACKHDYLVTAPCDSPLLPGDLVNRLRNALTTAGAQLAVAKTGNQVHPVFALMRASVGEHLSTFLSQGGRKIDRWYGSLATVEVHFDDEEAAFRNINTRDELRQLDSAASLPQSEQQ